MRTTFRFTPAWLVTGLLSLAACGEQSPRQAVARETDSSTVVIVEPESTAGSSDTPAPIVPATFAEAEVAFREKRYDAAVDGFAAYTTRRPSNPLGFYMLGLSSWKAGDLPGAEDAFKQALALDSTHVKSYLNLSRVLIESGQPDSAMGYLNIVLRIDETLGEAYRLIGRVHDARGEQDEAVTAYHEALLLDSTDVWSMNNLGLVLIHQGAFDDALRPLARAAELSPEVATFQNNLGIALERTGHFLAAADAYRAALAADSNFTKAQVNLDRVSGLKEDPNIGTIDLKVLSQGFNAQIAAWATQEN
ncbi:MAG: tetratricopeptide repeat protein [Woeseiaceae bacterium]